MALLTGLEDGNEWVKAIQGSIAAAKGYRYVMRRKKKSPNNQKKKIIIIIPLTIPPSPFPLSDLLVPKMKDQLFIFPPPKKQLLFV